LEQRVIDRTLKIESIQKELVRKEKLATLGQLTATVSHEIRNPLGTIRSSIFAIDEKIRGKGLKVERALDRIERNVIRCDKIIEELFDYARAKEAILIPTQVDPWLGDLLNGYSVPEKIQLKKHLNSKAKAMLDSEKFRRCIINLMDNACQAMNDDNHDENKFNGSTNDNHLTIKSCIFKNRLEIRISDSGPGVPKEELQKIFEPLFSTKNFGLGLGLPIVKQIMEQHKGGFKIMNNKKNNGATAIIWLPVFKTSG